MFPCFSRSPCAKDDVAKDKWGALQTTVLDQHILLQF